MDNKPAVKKGYQTLNTTGQFKTFFANDQHEYVVKKSERLSSAIHVVTSLMSNTEPIRTRLRMLSINVLESVTNRDNLMGESIKPAVLSIEIAALLDTAQTAGLISNMNAKMIADEYAALAFYIKDKGTIISSRTHDIALGNKDSIKDIGYKKQNASSVKIESKRQVVGDSRKSEILSLFSKKDKVSVNDVMTVLSNMSNKTAQRILMSMVQDGTLVKEGDKRWTTYKLASKGVPLSEPLE
ncbi:MAG: hypothetical protein RLZZ283_399 [Candidatus Parcubacteria bacterium]|jgi:predicted transcriptional regulator